MRARLDRDRQVLRLQDPHADELPRAGLIDAMAVDAKGNAYTAEVDTGTRIRKFRLTSDTLK
ncbi:hypothetical protein C7U92_08640 [Bradyrhizobium sp. WBOS7]|uniref:Uncharacterized protein n=1 Tax=Bradyrhizobium betae TaxID=244734 RepID=A0AAE9NEF2_9BRAD|nr:hypothetical protein [Bradyrhizobium sp. WBOS2]MDD1570182.1 hypothetical protein [Bradyrhizobium sp. WBOS1]MDD1576802.1 hypothetical protein [Bradyrhizobium sp. WBOS7]MDD1599114.1 hypothetical protein [Bradyrhizobium sp. WBOS16]UUO36674.1 hypothetical protein DCK84_20305 [Bradyrhizobium sp. WBOS01]UUO42977.1 hypothetical protein DCM75_21060 [Bradyrhizobium sp. WBOS02]UUO54067.1 hypothetical protein DCM79_14445 [Bradyrhizobium sp. WBOS07]UUO68072.1 hypothetical protein DCM83_24555 [Bradyrh